MFFRYNAHPARLLRLFRAFCRQAHRLRRFKYVYGGLFLISAVVYWTILVMSWDGLVAKQASFANRFPMYAVVGSLFLLWSWVYAAVVFGTYPYQDSAISKGGRIFAGFLLLIPAFFILGVATNFWPMLATPLYLLAGPGEEISDVLVPWLWATAWLWILSRATVWDRLRLVQVEDFELDYLQKVLRPLLADLPDNAVCSLTCNPFSPIWTAQTEENSRGRYQFRVRDDVLLDFHAALPDGLEFSLRTLHTRIKKYKQGRKKTKYKGAKHRLVQSYRFEHPAIAALDNAAAVHRRNLDAYLKSAPDGFATEVRAEPGQPKLSIVQKKKFGGFRENLEAEDLPGAAMTLGVVRRVSEKLAAPAMPPKLP